MPYAVSPKPLFSLAHALALFLLGTDPSFAIEDEWVTPRTNASLQPCGVQMIRRRAVRRSSDAGTDRFGVRQLYPTAVGGRVWFLPDNAETKSAEWDPDGATKVGDGVFNNHGQVRMTVKSPTGSAWWRNVEMTGYVRYRRERIEDPPQRPTWSWYARGERHTSNFVVAGAEYNDRVPAPDGTVTPPGYGLYKDQASLNARCLGTAYHGNLYPPYEGTQHYTAGPATRVKIEKEISHVAGYTNPNPECAVDASLKNGRLGEGWFGLKVVIRNFAGNRSVKTELWLDREANNNWSLLAEKADTGDWFATSSATNPPIDGCGSPPFNYQTFQVLTWAAPWVTFRSDNVDWDFKSLSVREISPAP